ncbi:MAG: carboxypeptidase-like regulatory domain-containing protein [Cyanobacteria bacterium P01_D01_bin.156]
MVTQIGALVGRLAGWRCWQKQLNRLLPILNGVGLVLLCSQPGWSHGAIAKITHQFTIEASYTSGEPMSQAQVVVYSPGDLQTPWTTGQTDQQGKFEFNPDIAGNWEVVVRQAGHGTTVNVPVGAVQTLADQTATPGTANITNSISASPLQRWASAGAGLWGLVGTVLFFSRGKQSS